MREFYQRHPARVALMRGTEGEAVVRTARPQAIEYMHAGAFDTLLAADDSDPQDGEPALPDAIDAQATARWIDDALCARVEVPASIGRQVEALMSVIARH
jgi:anthranilate phosphoribosyltransferase